jgi:amino-acid N-acetyltransferase
MSEVHADTGYAVRRARLEDVPGIYRLLEHYSELGELLPRPRDDLYHNLREFLVVEHEGEIVACGALQIFTRELGEVRSLAVSTRHLKHGLGARMVARIEEEARSIGLTRLMALTYVVDFFLRQGFRVVEMQQLPEKVWGVCINCHKFQNCDEIAVLKHIQPA